MMATERYQIIHYDASPVWRQTVILENLHAIPCQFRHGQMVYQPSGIIRVGAMPNGLSGANCGIIKGQV